MQGGQTIVIASNTWEGQQWEISKVASVSDGNQVYLENQLAYDHNSLSVDSLETLSAEMGLLDRSITITSAAGSTGPGQGAFIFIKGNGSASLHNMACHHCGQVVLS